MLPPTSSTVWTDLPAAARPALDGDRDADVVVVGAGIAGLTTALLLAREGRDVVVLEGRRIGSGTTGRTTAKVSALQGLRYRTLMEVHGPDVARDYAQAQLDALAWVGDTVRDLGIECRWERRPAITYATDDRSRREVEEEQRAASAAGLSADLADAGLPFPTTGAVVVPDQAQFDPTAYLLGLADEIERLGGTVHEGSRVRALRGGDPQRAVTDHGVVRAPTAVVATLLPIVDRGLFFARAEPRASYTLAVDAGDDLPRGMYLSASSPTRSLRTAWNGDREVLVVGGGGHTVGREAPTTPQYEDLLAWATEHFPVREVTARWMAHDYVPSDQLPWAGPAAPMVPNVLVAAGFQKWGMTNGTAAASVLADRILGRSDGPSAPWAGLFDVLRPSLHGVKETTRLNAGVAAEMAKAWVRPPSDAEGRRRRVICTHLGGVCRPNDAEGTWDCPLHGSRFEPAGTILSGPATRDLGRAPGEP